MYYKTLYSEQIYTRLVLIVEIKQNKNAGRLYLLFYSRVHLNVDYEIFDQLGILCEKRFIYL